MLTTIQYKFFYKDKSGKMQNQIVEVSERNNELAIATFEKQYPDITWRSFIAL